MNLRGVQLMSGGTVQPRQVDALVLFLNGRWCSALSRLCCGPRDPSWAPSREPSRAQSRAQSREPSRPEVELVSPLVSERGDTKALW